MTVGNRIYPQFVGALFRAEVDAEAVTFAFQGLDVTATFDPADVFLSAIAGAEVGAAVTLPGVTLTVGTSYVDLDADDDPPLVLDATGLQAVALVVFVDTGSPATSPLVAWYDRRADSTPILVDDDTGEVTFPYGYFVRAGA